MEEKRMQPIQTDMGFDKVLSTLKCFDEFCDDLKYDQISKYDQSILNQPFKKATNVYFRRRKWASPNYFIKLGLVDREFQMVPKDTYDKSVKEILEKINSGDLQFVITLLHGILKEDYIEEKSIIFPMHHITTNDMFANDWSEYKN